MTTWQVWPEQSVFIKRLLTSVPIKRLELYWLVSQSVHKYIWLHIKTMNWIVNDDRRDQTESAAFWCPKRIVCNGIVKSVEIKRIIIWGRNWHHHRFRAFIANISYEHDDNWGFDFLRMINKEWVNWGWWVIIHRYIEWCM